MISATNLGVRFGNKWIFRGLEFEVSKGQVLAVLGRNGSGKSTLLRVIGGLQKASEGAYTLPGGDPRLKIGYSALDLSLYSDLSVAEHLEFTGSLRGCNSRAQELLELVGLSRSAKVLAEHLSSGMRARLRLAIALQATPDVLLLDEPSASLDGEGRDLVARICKTQLESGCVILATNDPLEQQLATHELKLDS